MFLTSEKVKNVLPFVSKTALQTITTMPLHLGKKMFH